MHQHTHTHAHTYIYVCVCVCVTLLASWVESSPMFQEIRVQPQVKSYQRLKMVCDAALLNTQYYKVRTNDKWSNPGKRVAPYPTPCGSSY